MLGQPVPAKVQTDAMASDAVAQVLCALLPEGAQVVACWRDWAIGAGGAVTAEACPELRGQAEQALWDRQPAQVQDPLTVVRAWSNPEGNARMSVAASLPAAVPPAQLLAWENAARALIGATLESERAQARVVTLEKSKRLQQALYEIADVASADLEMPEMLRRIQRTSTAPRAVAARWGGPPLTAAQREFAEETDLVAEHWAVLSDFWTSPGGSDESVRVYLARGVSAAARTHARTEEEAGIELRWASLDEAVDAVLERRIRNAITAIALLAARASRERQWSTLAPADAPWPRHPDADRER